MDLLSSAVDSTELEIWVTVVETVAREEVRVDWVSFNSLCESFRDFWDSSKAFCDSVMPASVEWMRSTISIVSIKKTEG